MPQPLDKAAFIDMLREVLAENLEINITSELEDYATSTRIKVSIGLAGEELASDWFSIREPS